MGYNEGEHCFPETDVVYSALGESEEQQVSPVVIVWREGSVCVSVLVPS